MAQDTFSRFGMPVAGQSMSSLCSVQYRSERLGWKKVPRGVVAAAQRGRTYNDCRLAFGDFHCDAEGRIPVATLCVSQSEKSESTLR